MYLESSAYTVFSGASYSSGESTNVRYLLDSRLSLASDIGGNTIVFARLTGAADRTGTIRITASSDSSRFRELTVGERGEVTLGSN